MYQYQVQPDLNRASFIADTNKKLLSTPPAGTPPVTPSITPAVTRTPTQTPAITPTPTVTPTPSMDFSGLGAEDGKYLTSENGNIIVL